MVSIVSICNSALLSLGAETINNFDEGSTEANACKAKWDITLNSLLRSYPWNFATTRNVQTLPREDLPEGWEFSYQYPLPYDCIRVVKVYKDPTYKLEGRNILSNCNECFIKYITNKKDISEWDPLFVDLMASRMTYELAYTLPRTGSMVDRSYKLYKTKWDEATSIDQSEDIPEDFGQFESSLITSRQYGRY